jgi:hypothetical protein
MLGVHQQVMDYLVDEYAVERKSMDLSRGGKHAKLKFPWEGKVVSLTLPMSPSDTNWFVVKCGDVRRLLGPPPPKNANGRLKRTLDDLTRDVCSVVVSAPLPDTATSEEPLALKLREALPTSLALYGSNKQLQVNVPADLADEFYSSRGPRGCVVDFTAPDLFTVRHTQGDKPAIVPSGELFHRLQVGASDIWNRIGAFNATKAEAWLEGGRIRVRLTEPFQKPGRKQAQPLVEAERPVKLDDSLLKSLLASIAEVESTTPYRLERDEAGFFWRAVLEVR